MPVRLLAFFAWALLACSAAYWALQLLVKPMPVPAHAVPVGDGAAPRGDLSRLFGSTPVNPEVPVLAPAQESRFKLLGLVAPKQGLSGHQSEGVALIAVDGGLPRTVRVGGLVDGELRLLAMEARSVSLGRDGVSALTLRLEPPAAAATGTLPPATTAAPVDSAPAPQGGMPPPMRQPEAPPVLRHDARAQPVS